MPTLQGRSPCSMYTYQHRSDLLTSTRGLGARFKPIDGNHLK